MSIATAGRPVGHTYLRVPPMGLGTAPLGGMYTSVSEEQAVETVRHALEHGMSFLDTAPFYGAGRSEQYVGSALQGVPRDTYVLATKVGRLVRADGSIVYDFSRDGVLRSLEESLQRLKLDRVDILHIHDADNHYREALDNAFPALAELRDQGAIGAVGAGMNQWAMLSDFARNADFDCFLLAGRYTLLEQGALDEFLPLCEQKGIGVFLGGVFNSGVLASGSGPEAKYNYSDAPAEVTERVARIEAVCARHGVPLPTAALQFPLAHPAVTALLVGARSATENEANLAALEAPVAPQLWADLKVEGLLSEHAPVPA